ncbi:MAG TPA: TIGR03067 domain-containing protein [Kofleriaceae bacterium]|nr:TIGR03067 domain-containing protein [Kofleriaceae bacterium]
MSDLDRLQGRWRQIASSIDGGAESVAPAGDEFAGDLVTVFERDAFRVLDAAGAVVLAGRFVLDEAAHAIDWIDAFGPDAGVPLPAIYELTATTFAFAAADAGMPRPTRLAAAPGVTLRRFVRVSDEA